ncbi:MAG: hypothetical protein U0414_14975 [Polyangiaceae bacterium]
MRFSKGIGSVAVLALALSTREAVAEPSDGFITASAIVGTAFGLADIGFFAYDIVQANDETEPTEGAMIAQSLVTGPQAAVGVLMMTFGQVDEDGGPAITLAALAPATLANGLLTFGAWSLEGSRLSVGTRLGISMMIGADAALTTGALTASIIRPHYATPYLAVPEIILGSAQAIPSFVMAARDPSHFGSWMALGIWTSALTVHGTLSLVANVAGIERERSYSSNQPAAARGARATWTAAPALIRPPWRMDGGGHSPGVLFAGQF